MKRTCLIIPVIMLLTSFAVFPRAQAIAAGEPSVDTLVRGNSVFAIKLYHELCGAEGNLFFSPYSISSALAMALAGARENTATEMKKALNFEMEDSELHPTFGNLNNKLITGANTKGQKLNIANGLCLTGGDIDKQFKAVLKNDYDAELFGGDLNTINNWVAKKTEGKIKKILAALDPDSICVILNAIYFKGTWESQFEEKSTHEAPFLLSAKDHIPAAFMYQRTNYNLLSEKDFQAISIPYKGAVMSMIVLLPRDIDGLGEFERGLTADKLEKWFIALDNSSSQETELYLPKITFESEYDLGAPCRKLGIKDAFDAGKADFSGMGWPKGKLWISQIKHKAFVEVNEEGTEAAAATAIDMATESVKLYPVFRADHPFIFLIRDNSTGSILFMGKILNPSTM